MRRSQNADLITVAVPPQRLGWLCSLLDKEGIPHQEDGRGNVTTLEVAQPIVDQVLGYKAQRAVNPWPMDIRVLGFVASLGLVVVSFMQSAGVEPVAANVGLDPLITRGVVFLVVGVIVTFAMSEGLLRDPRRGWFVLGMLGLFLAGALWFVLQGMGVL